MKLLNLNELEMKALDKALSFFYDNGWIDDETQEGFDSLTSLEKKQLYKQSKFLGKDIDKN